MNNQQRNYGFVPPSIDLNAYTLGGQTKLPKIILQPDGQWGAFAPKYEPQFNEFFDSYGCTVWGSQNGFEFLFKRIEGVEYNFSERFNYIISRIRPPGADPHKVLMDMHDHGVIPDERLPMTRFSAEFLTPDPMTDLYLKEGREFPYILSHEWVVYGTTTGWKEKMMEALQYSRLCAGVYAWAEDDGIYKRMGSDTHWTVIFGYKENEYWLCFDSYDQSVKKLDWNFGFSWVKRLYAEKKTDNIKSQISILMRIAELLKKVIFLRQILNTLGGKWDEWFGDRTLGAKRSSGWGALSKEMIREHPLCEMGLHEPTILNPLNVHHILEFHNFPEEEMKKSNLSVLCRFHHFLHAHLKNWSRSNHAIREDCATLN